MPLATTLDRISTTLATRHPSSARGSPATAASTAAASVPARAGLSPRSRTVTATRNSRPALSLVLQSLATTSPSSTNGTVALTPAPSHTPFTPPTPRNRASTLARTAADALTPSAKRHTVTLTVEIQRTAGRLTADARRIREVVEHLLRHAIANAAAGTDGEGRAGGSVLLHVDGNARIARIIVSDDGEGMDAEARARAFDRFAETTIAPGTDRALGLGLPLAKQFVEAHGGTIKLQSERGQGTLVTVELPRR